MGVCAGTSARGGGPGALARIPPQSRVGAIKRGTHRGTLERERAIREYRNIYNENAKSFIWIKTAD